jgi:endonuclease/exonuclease/phosphatase family metal-dependent hydrolase
VRFDAILAELRRQDCDLLLLQEVDRHCRRSGGRDVARDLAHALGMNWVAAGEFQEIGEAVGRQPALTGQAILSRFPIECASAHRFEAQARWRWTLNPVQPRRGGRIVLQAQSGGVSLYNTHLESGSDEQLRLRQMTAITRDAARHLARPTLLAGDLNNATVTRSPMLRHLAADSFVDAVTQDAREQTTSVGAPHPIDWVFTRRLTAISGGIVPIDPRVSDHHPLVACVRTDRLAPAAAPADTLSVRTTAERF